MSARRPAVPAGRVPVDAVECSHPTDVLALARRQPLGWLVLAELRGDGYSGRIIVIGPRQKVHTLDYSTGAGATDAAITRMSQRFPEWVRREIDFVLAMIDEWSTPHIAGNT